MIDLEQYLETTGVFEKLERRGDEIHARCPFADNERHAGMDTHPSWSINARSGLWHCFGCGEGGRLGDLVRRLRLPAILGLDTGETDASKQAEFIRRRLGLLPTPEKATPYWPLPESFTRFDQGDTHPSAEYLFKILNWESIVKFGVGYCSLNGDIVFPIAEKNGYQIAWQRRVLPGAPSWRPVYQFPPEFEKSRYLYNIHAYGSEDQVVVVEGIKKAIVMSQFGLAAVSSLNCSISTDQVVLLGKVGEVILLFDGDGPGREGAEKAEPLLWTAFGERASVATLPDRGKKDSGPDDFPFEVVEKTIENRRPVRSSMGITSLEIRKKLDYLRRKAIE
jgi:DNA primase